MALEKQKTVALLVAICLSITVVAAGQEPGPKTAPTPAGSLAAGEGASAARRENGVAKADALDAQSERRGMSDFGNLSFTSVDEPIVVEADRLEFDYEKNRLVYKGSVHVVQGDFELSSNTLVVSFQRSGDLEGAELSEVVARGDVVITQQDRQASGQIAVFNQEKRKIVMRGNPVLRDGANEVQGDRITVFLDEGRTVVNAAPSKRVSAVLYPGSEEGKAAGNAVASPEKGGDIR